MVVKAIDYYEVSVKFLVRKKYWDADNGIMDEDIIKDKVQQGIEVPIDDVEVSIKK